MLPWLFPACPSLPWLQSLLASSLGRTGHQKAFLGVPAPHAPPAPPTSLCASVSGRRLSLPPPRAQTAVVGCHPLLGLPWGSGCGGACLFGSVRPRQKVLLLMWPLDASFSFTWGGVCRLLPALMALHFDLGVTGISALPQVT